MAHERRFTGFDDKILALYARGLTVREIQAFLLEMYAVDVSPALITWASIIPFFAFPPEVRRAIYTTNPLESVHARIRKVIKTRGHFPNDDAVTKLIWLALRNITAEWRRPAHHWRAAMNQFAILYEDRFTKAML